MIMVKNRFKGFMELHFKVSPLHIIATFITPCFRSRKFSNQNLSEEAESLLDELLMEVPESDLESNNDNPIATDQYRNSIFDSYMEKPSKKSVEGSEVQRYLSHKLTEEDIRMSPLKFWWMNKTLYPKISNLAFWLLSTPATNNSSERVFSSAGNVVTPHRSCLDTDTVDKLLFVRSNFDLMEDLKDFFNF